MIVVGIEMFEVKIDLGVTKINRYVEVVLEVKWISWLSCLNSKEMLWT